ncbi:HNH endonuclease [Geodermatophilus siccatus]|uniref:HNH endonuclease n=1 Tax=Geodermatophilus siccatus TaxID=1137991 RepID=A0A1G9V2L0_9ACTN|nr:HNH endonuclease signature motif containing protein [Geodermatophilus siccatus]SDM66115.1 HNH endonuclease [Geodermatophilus siccatus]
MSTSKPGGPPDGLPEPDSDEIRQMFSNRETREAYRFLYERRSGPLPTMGEWVAEAESVLGKANVHTQRRLRDVRDYFIVSTRKVGSDWVYQLEGRKTDAAADAGAKISPRLQAEVFTVKGRFCAMCGRGPADGVRLQIDHIIPRSWGGETTVENLEPLCVAHNHGKQAFFESLNPYADAITRAIKLETPWERIGELLIAMREIGNRVPAELLPIVGLESHKGDPARRLRDLRVVLGWAIRVYKRREGRATVVEYELIEAKPWPPEGPKEAVNRYERERKRRKAAQRCGDDR